MMEKFWARSLVPRVPHLRFHQLSPNLPNKEISSDEGQRRIFNTWYGHTS
jgi:hypothetical protein